MPITQRLLLCIPTPILGAIIVGAFVSFSVGGLLLVRRFVSHHKLKVHNDVAGPMFETLGMAYAVLLAFVVVIAWQSFDRSDLNVEKEANCIVDLYRDSSAFQETFKDQIRPLIKGYTDTVISEEWAMLARGEESPRAHEILKKVWAEYSSYEPKTEREKIFLAESVHKLNEAGELRRMRLIDSRKGIHPVLWFVLTVGGLITIVFPFFFGSENFRAQLLMVSMLSILIAMILFTVLLLDFPFTGEVNISSDAFKHIAHF